MAKVVYMAERKSISPKTETFDHGGQKYTCTFDPNAPKHQQWVWHVEYVRKYPYFGSCPTMEAAASKARKLIHSMNTHVIKWEESNE